ncbi:MAG: PDGLE domain-containing protein [Syntrophothermaceae bacterium]|jgi:hypothetical protein
MMREYKKLWMALGIIIFLTPLGLLATGTAYGEWSTDELAEVLGFVPGGLARFADFWQGALLPDYGIPGMTATFMHSAVGYIVSAVIGVVLVVGITMLFAKVVKD